MLVFTARRLLLTLPLLFVLPFGFYALTYAGASLTCSSFDYHGDRGMCEQSIKEHGLDRPSIVQFADYVCGGLCVSNARHGGIVTGDWGTSHRNRQPVTDVLRETIPVSALFGLASLVVLYVVGIPLGVLSAVMRRSWPGHVIAVGSTVARSVPIFVLGIMAAMVVGDRLQVVAYFHVERDGLSTANAILLVVLVAVVALPGVVMLTRSGVLDALAQDHVRTARARGLPEWRVLIYVARDVLTSLVKELGPTLAALFIGLSIVEYLFPIRGFAYEFLHSFQTRDSPLTAGAWMLGVAVVLMIDLAAKLGHAMLDPRVRRSFDGKQMPAANLHVPDGGAIIRRPSDG